MQAASDFEHHDRQGRRLTRDGSALDEHVGALGHRQRVAHAQRASPAGQSDRGRTVCMHHLDGALAQRVGRQQLLLQALEGVDDVAQARLRSMVTVWRTLAPETLSATPRTRPRQVSAGSMTSVS